MVAGDLGGSGPCEAVGDTEVDGGIALSLRRAAGSGACMGRRRAPWSDTHRRLTGVGIAISTMRSCSCPIARPHPVEAIFRGAGAILSAAFRTGRALG